MASLKLIFSLIVLTSSVTIFVPCSSLEGHSINVIDSEKVNVSLYYETLCHGCSGFILDHLGKVFEGDLISIVNLRLVPYGNARVVRPQKTVVCQHGPEECYYNSIEACAIHFWSDVNQHFKFIQCLERSIIKDMQQSKEDAWKSCSLQLKLNPETLGKCYDSGYAKKLILGNANETDHLVPPHEYVPWVVVNTQPLFEDFENFVTYVCKAYKGCPKPKACDSITHNLSPAGNPTKSVCYKGEENMRDQKVYD